MACDPPSYLEFNCGFEFAAVCQSYFEIYACWLTGRSEFRTCEAAADAGDGQSLANFGRMPTGMKSPMTSPVSRNAALPEQENVLHGDDIAFHAGNFGHVGDFARAVAQAGDLHDDVDRRSNLPAARRCLECSSWTWPPWFPGGTERRAVSSREWS